MLQKLDSYILRELTFQGCLETHEKKMNLNHSGVQRHSTLFQDLRTHAREFHVRCHSSGLGVDQRPEHAPDKVRLFSIIRKGDSYIRYMQTIP